MRMYEETREEAAMLWGDVVQLAQESGEAGMAQWLDRLLPISFDGATLTCAAKLKWTERKVMTTYRELIEACIQEITMEPIALAVVVDPAYFADGAEGAPAVSTPAAAGTAPAAATPTPDVAPVAQVAIPQAAPAPSNPPAEPTSVPQPSFAPQPAASPVAAAPSPAALAGAQAAASRTTHPLVGLRAKIPASAQAALATPQTDVPQAAPTPAPQAPIVSAPTPEAVPAPQPSAAVPTPQPSPEPLSEFTFDTFVVGEANRMAFDAARTMAEEEIVPYNPLFLYSKPGLGKTHLLRAIQNYVQMYRPGIRVLYAESNVLAENYVDDITVKKLRGSEVLRRYREADVLLIDDVQFLKNKKETQVTFFDIFNQLRDSGKHIVLAADEAPDYLELDERLKQRFGMGLVIDIAMPSHELKQTILRNYAQTYATQTARLRGVELTEDALDYMAELSPNNIREMQGFLKRVMMEQSSAPTTQLTHERIKAVRDKLFKTSRRVDIAMIIDVVCEDFGVTSADVRGKGRTKLVSEARQVTMWLARQMTDESYQAIGNHFGRDHSTVTTSVKKIEGLSQDDPTYLNRLEQLKKRVEGRASQ